jgi:hypothetical protein
MGMFDSLRCVYPLPVAGANELVYQTKDLDCMMDEFEIRADGTLWHEAYETRVEESEDAPLGIWIHRDNKRWEPVPLTGEVRFYELLGAQKPHGWLEWSACFVEGALKELHLIRHEPAGVDAIHALIATVSD